MCVDIVRWFRWDAAIRCTLLSAVLACLPFRTFAISPEGASPAGIPALLEQQGWRYTAGADGSAYYHPPQAAAVPGAAQDTGPPDVVDRAQLRRMLRERGWRLEADAQGNLFLIPIRPPTPPDINRMLRERGWRVLTDTDGNTLLMPVASPTPAAPTAPAAPPAGSAEATQAAVDQPSDEEPAAQFRRALEDKGWSVRAESDGSMIVYPPVSASPEPGDAEGPGATPRGYCEGITLTVEELRLPVDSEEKAQLLATAWIAQFGQAGYEVGRTRRVNQVFVVSIVESAAPHALRNQLVVREDGSIVALY